MTVGPRRGGSLAARGIIAVILVGVGAWVVLNSAFFAIREVRVIGARGVSEANILRIAAVEEGENLITFPLAEVATRLENHPRIAVAEVERDLPTTVVIRVHERRPAGWVAGPDGPLIVAADGTIIMSRQQPPQTLPAMGSWPEELTPGDTIDGLGHQLRISSDMSSWLRARIATAELDDGDVILELRDGGTVLYGTPEDVEEKNRALEGVLEWSEAQGIAVRTVDVRVPSAPSLAPVKGPALPAPIPTP